MKDHEIKLIYSEEGVSETIGYSLILAIVLVAVGVLVVIAYPIQSNIQDTAFIESQIQALTMLDGRISSVALGSSPSQLTRINLNGGTMYVRNYSDNYLNITVTNQTGYSITIFNKTLGLIEYKLGENRLIYENGGMFRVYPNGESVMLSPPEFYFNGETLTFPVIRLDNSASVGGKGTISVMARSGEEKKIIYPDLSSNFLMNPIYGKQIKIRLKSDNYKAWGRYIEERTDAVPLTNDVTKEVVVSFNSKPSEGPVELKVPIEVFGLDTTNSTPLTQFKFNLTGVGSNLNMMLRAPESDSEIFSIQIKKATGVGEEGVVVYVNYNNGGANESWFANKLALITTADTATVDLLNASVNSKYNTNDLSVTWENETPPLYNKTYIKNDGETVPINVVMQHYMKLVSPTGTFSIYSGTKTSDKWDGFNATNSTYTLSYSIMPPNINYLHIVDHAVNVTLS
ncbi:MAG: hypothetical protein KKG76_13230 [Euryarchaeota archaeon]|nr:hypothetical protein [Euryarchaeota archaeon]MBU4077143.1 hypothetical protein [Euryarchaeota archaeon]MBU4138576.1 hypothetical protein [Euryarchaeota archaeon]